MFLTFPHFSQFINNLWHVFKNINYKIHSLHFDSAGSLNKQCHPYKDDTQQFQPPKVHEHFKIEFSHQLHCN